MNYKAWCCSCKKIVEIKDQRIVDTENSRGKRRAAKGVCPTCGTKLNVFIKNE